jgi:ribose transport system substrate-binding protein
MQLHTLRHTAVVATSATVTLALSLAAVAQAAPTQAATLEAASASTFTVGFANEATTAPFQVNVQNSMTEAAKAAGVKLISLNNNYDDATSLRNATILANDKVNVAVEFQVDSKIAPEIAQTFSKAGIKWTISIDIPQPGAIFFGASNYADGELAGEHAGKYAAAHGWKPSQTTEVLLNLPAAGPIPQLRMNGARDGLAKYFPGVPQSQILQQSAGDGTTSAAQTVMASLLPRIPTSDHIVLFAINDESAQGGLRAIQVAGREASTIVSGQGADAVGLSEIKSDSHWIGDTAYFPEYYGKYIFQVIADLRAGKKVTPYVFMPRVYLTAATVAQYYPGKDTVAIKPPPGGPQFSTSPKQSLNG